MYLSKQMFSEGFILSHKSSDKSNKNWNILNKQASVSLVPIAMLMPMYNPDIYDNA